MGFLRRILGGQPAERPHDDPELESMLPATVAGRSLERWSVRGERAYAVGRSLDVREVADIEADLAAVGVALADVSHAIAGRARSSDPPYLIDAWRFGERPATESPLDLAN